MKLAFPYLGPTIAYKKVAELLGHEVLMPPPPSQRTIDLGVKYSPEFACFPFKIIMGSYIEAVEQGVDTIVTSGGNGPCRAGFYAEVHKRILKKLGYDVRFIVFDSMFKDFKRFKENFNLIRGDNSMIQLVKKASLAFKMLRFLDDAEKEILIKRAYEVNEGDFSAIWEDIKELFDKTYTKEELDVALQKARQWIDSVPLREVEEDEKIRIGVVGEILVAMEPTANMEVERRLNSLGAEVENIHNITNWLRHNAVPSIFGKSHSQKLIDLGAKYVPIPIGGHHQENMGGIIDFKNRGFDGVVHLMPFGCLPELVSQSVITRMQKDIDIPVLSLSLDEHSGQVNTTTRLEAFIDLVRNHKVKMKNKL